MFVRVFVKVFAEVSAEMEELSTLFIHNIIIVHQYGTLLYTYIYIYID